MEGHLWCYLLYRPWICCYSSTAPEHLPMILLCHSKCCLSQSLQTFTFNISKCFLTLSDLKMLHLLLSPGASFLIPHRHTAPCLTVLLSASFPYSSTCFFSRSLLVLLLLIAGSSWRFLLLYTQLLPPACLPSVASQVMFVARGKLHIILGLNEVFIPLC